MDEFRSRRAGHAAGLRIDAVETLPTDLGTVLVRVAGTWEGSRSPAIAAPVLVLSDERSDHRVASLPETSGAATRAALDERPFRAAFSVPGRLAGLLRGPLRLALGGVTVDLPPASSPAGGQSAQPEGTVVDRAVLAERRARRAELAEAAARRGAQEAERAVARMETELAGLELRLDAAAEEHDALEVELNDRERELRASRQHAHAEQRRREDAVSDARRRVARAEGKAAELREALTRVDRRTRDLKAEVAAARRQADEANQRAETAIARLRRSEPAAGGRDREPTHDVAVLRAELTLASSPLRVPPLTRPTAPGPARAHTALLQQERHTARRAAAAEARLLGERQGRARAEVELGERVLALAREANRQRARADAEQRAREVAEAELEVVVRGRREADARVATLTATVTDLQEKRSRTEPEPEPPTPMPEPRTGSLPEPPGLPEPGPGREWLRIGLGRLVAENATAAARLALELLPGQALTGRPVSYDLLVGTLGWHEVTLGPVRGRVVGRQGPRERGAAAFRVTATPATLVTLVTRGGSPGVGRAARVTGTLRRRRARRSLAPVPLDTCALADAGIWIDPLLLHRALALSIEPDWTHGHGFCLEHIVEGRREGRCYVTVSDGDRVSVRARPPREGATTAVRTSQRAFQRALGGAVESGRDVEGEGDVRALAQLIAWARWGEGGADSDG